MGGGERGRKEVVVLTQQWRVVFQSPAKAMQCCMYSLVIE